MHQLYGYETWYTLWLKGIYISMKDSLHGVHIKKYQFGTYALWYYSGFLLENGNYPEFSFQNSTLLNTDIQKDF